MIIAVIGESDARPHIAELAEEVGRELAENIPVIGLQTWALARSGEPPDTTIITATDPVQKAIRAANNRLQTFKRRRRNSDKTPFDGFS